MVQVFRVPEMTSAGLKNKGKTTADMNERRTAAAEYTKTSLENIGAISFDALAAEKNVENMIGAIQVPLGYVGPYHIKGDYAEGEFLVPLATTEGALIASVNRGCSVISRAGGASVKVVKDEMTRAPVFRTRDIRHATEVSEWIEANLARIKEAAESTTSHGKLLSVMPFPAGRSLHVRFAYETGDAMGMNMATIATEAAAKLIAQETGAVLISVSGNMCTDKKPAAVNGILGRGKTIVADALIPRALLEEKMHTTAAATAETCLRKCAQGSALAGSLGQNAHAANMIAALYIATGQDPAQVVEGSLCMTSCEDLDGDLYISVRLPAVEVGTVGGGTRLPCQQEALQMIDCLGPGKAKKLAEIVGAVVLAGELSTLCAQAAGHLGNAHQQLGR